MLKRADEILLLKIDSAYNKKPRLSAGLYFYFLPFSMANEDITAYITVTAVTAIAK